MSIEIARWPAVLRSDGRIAVTAWTRCPVGLTAFEFDITIGQGSSYGSNLKLVRDAVPCDGVRHQYRVLVEPALGSFTTGEASISAYLSGNDGQHGDTEAYDEAIVAVRDAGTGPVAWIARVPRPVAADGTVWIRVWARCDSDQQAFELDIDVVQGDAYGPVMRLAPPAVVLCDGTRHRTSVHVRALDGASFTSGPAQVGMFLGVFDNELGDFDLSDQTTLTFD
jgi:hypothetical protein